MPEVVPSERWTQLETLFLAATELPAAQRAAFLDAHCAGDAALRADVESLLAYDQTNDTALLSALEAGAAHVLEGDSLLGLRLGPWRIERELGRGGMAVVYLAARADGEFQQQVALKLIKRGMDTDAVIARLRRERRILAALDHPGISRLLDGGSTPDGRPWIAMEFIAGVQIDRFCDERHASPAERCALLARVCDAVAYAHRNLVVHGDLKPGNILVNPAGDPKLLDFGIARLLAPEGDEAGQLTGGAPRPFTPAFASPEQITGGIIGTASDIYSLGVVARQLLPGAKGDLAAIFDHACQPQPGQRYRSIEEFGDDLRRFLAGKPVSARRASWLRRSAKFLNRHRLAAALASAAVAVMVTGAALYLREARQAKRNFDNLHQFVNAFLFDVDDQLASLPGSTAARAVIVQNAIGYLNGLALQERGDRDLQAETAEAWRRVADLQGDANGTSLGDIAGAHASYLRAIALAEPLARSEKGPHRYQDERDQLMVCYTQFARLQRVSEGNLAGARGLLDKALVIARQVGSPPDPRLQGQLGQVLLELSWIQEASGDIAGEVQSTREASSLLQTAGARDPATFTAPWADSVSRMAAAEARLGDIPASRRDYHVNLTLRQRLAAAHPTDYESQRDLMLAWGHLGDLDLCNHCALQDIPAALADYRQALAQARAIAASDAANRTAQVDVAIAAQRLAAALASASQHRPALAQYQASLDILIPLANQSPRNALWSFYVAFNRTAMSAQYFHLGQSDAGWAALGQSIAGYTSLIQSAPNNADYPFSLVDGMRSVASALSASGDIQGLARLAAQTEPFMQQALRSTNVPHRIGQLAVIWSAFGDDFAALHDDALARRYWRLSAAIWQGLHPIPAEFSTQAAALQSHLAALDRP